MGKLFGTDGVRGRFGEAPITPELVMKLGWAVGSVLCDSGKRSHVLIGKDTRISGYILESALEAGFASAGVDVSLLGPMPTPGIAYLTRTARASIGVVVSASHNSFEDNGIKFFSGDGLKLNDELIAKIEAKMEQPLHTVSPESLGKAHRFEDAVGRYIEFCKHTLPYRIDLEGLRIVVDCANGAAYQVTPKVLSELGADMIVIGNKPDGFNINKGCGSTALDALKDTVLKTKADIGIALDGDADRLMLVDNQGQEIDGDQILYILAKFHHSRDTLNGGVVGTSMTNLGCELALEQLGIPFVRTDVGDRFVLEELIKRDWQLGGETSGHIICLDKNTTGDGTVAALQVMRVMLSTKKSLHELVAGMDKFPQIMINVAVARNSGDAIVSDDKLLAAVRAAEASLGRTGRIVLRPSGTEPKVRVMVEGDNSLQIKEIARSLAVMVEDASDRI